MSPDLLAVDDALLEEWRGWIGSAVKRFGASGYGETATAYTVNDVFDIAHSPELLYAAALEHDGARGLVFMVRSLWETNVLSRTVAKVAWLAADDFATTVLLARAVLEQGRAADVVLLSASPGHSPLYIHAGLTEAGFHVGSQTFTVRADLDAIAATVAKIPLRGSYREATPADADAVAELARHGLEDQRYTRDPYFPREWGEELYAAWARNLVMGAADTVVVAEAHGEIIGFISMALDPARQAAVPSLLAIDQRYNGRGTGAALVRIMLDWHRERGVKIFLAGTEKSNVPINAMHIRIGGSFIDSNIVYHASPALREPR